MTGREDIVKEIADHYGIRTINILLTDRTTRKKILWVADDYAELGAECPKDGELSADRILTEAGSVIRPRVRKLSDCQSSRTRDRAEVFTPAWICNLQNNLVDEAWFGRPDVFNRGDGRGWHVNRERIVFPDAPDRTWNKYVDAKRLEITCGEAPYLASRYDMVTGTFLPVEERVGILDRKLRIVDENTDSEEEWLFWSRRAFESVYGFEYQGDSLFLARCNLLYTYLEYRERRLGGRPSGSEVNRIALILSWNIWQMDGATCRVPMNDGLYCILKDWRTKRTAEYRETAEKDAQTGAEMKFEAIVGNPPYQEIIHTDTDNRSLGWQLFPYYVMAALEAGAEYVSLITPARWFAGDAQDKSFVKLRSYIRENNHIRSMYYYRDAKELFANVEIKGGVQYFLSEKSYEGDVDFYVCAQGERKLDRRSLFTEETDLIIEDADTVPILRKVRADGFVPLTEITTGRNAFGIIGKPVNVEAVSRKKRFRGSVPLRCKSNVIRWMKPDTVKKNRDIFESYKVFVSKSAGNPSNDAKVIGYPYVGEPFSACTDSLIPIGRFGTREEAEHLAKYLKTRFVRFLVQILKSSQNVTQIVYRFVPMQDFTDASDIDWSGSVEEIEGQLYAKYDFTREEIDYVEAWIQPVE
ncbi:MAG: Eco57I restriction-modification methylase domain-containing protein [Muribaculum sp.]|nr:Eco57I restriction-modification methylase domain-containing protein [Muribaculum sp.]